MASRCQVAHDFTQRHVLAACAEAAIPAPRYLLKIGSVRDAAGPGPTFSNVNLSLVATDVTGQIVESSRRGRAIYASGFRSALTSCAERR